LSSSVVLSYSRTVHYYSLTFLAGSLLLFRHDLAGLVSLAVHDDLSTHIVLIPVATSALIYLRRKHIFHTARFSPAIGFSLLLALSALWFALRRSIAALSGTDQLSAITALIVSVWVAAFVLFYGFKAARAAAFPLLLLIVIVPIPTAVKQQAVYLLQHGSAETCAVLFRLAGIPYLRKDVRFSLPGIDIEVAEQCSGIHSAVSLFITALLVANTLLPKPWTQVCFMLFVIPIAIVKNALRIVTIAWLGIYVNPKFFEGELHREGGLAFSLPALAMMAVLLWLFRRIRLPGGIRLSSVSRKEMNGGGL
jgi:exosortase